MDDLIIRYLQDNASEAEARELERWRSASEANEARFQEFADLWALTAVATPHVETTPPLVGELVRRAEDHAVVALPSRGRRVPHPHVRPWVAVAAAIAVLGTGLYAAGLFSRAESPQVASASFKAAEYHTGAVERATARLPDGTIVRLAPSSRLRLIERAGMREVFLDGEAFFAVAHNPDVPFVVRTRAGDATVLGTRFDLRVTDEVLRVVVVEGRVGVKVGEDEVAVDAGQMTLAAEGARPSVVDVTDAYALLEWMGQSLVFQTTTLESAFHEIERLYGAEIEVLDAEILDQTITAWFTDQPFEEVITVVCRVAQLKCSVGRMSAVIHRGDTP